MRVLAAFALAFNESVLGMSLYSYSCFASSSWLTVATSMCQQKESLISQPFTEKVATVNLSKTVDLTLCILCLACLMLPAINDERNTTRHKLC